MPGQESQTILCIGIAALIVGMGKLLGLLMRYLIYYLDIAYRYYLHEEKIVFSCFALSRKITAKHRTMNIKYHQVSR